jgi:pyrimidine operon attenuation protein/uracil phosphoribosyltransferase
LDKIKIIDEKKLALMTARLGHELIENHKDFSNSIIIGLQPRGIHFAERIHKYLETQLSKTIRYGILDITFYRDDYKRRDELVIPNPTSLNFGIDGRKIILVDDVLFTGRSVRAGFDAIVDLGRPEKVELMVLIDRLHCRQFPIEADYLGQSVHSIATQKVLVELEKEQKKPGVWLISE